MGIPSADPAEIPGIFAASWNVDTAADPRLLQLLAHWRSLCRGERLPSRADIDPAHIPKLLPIVFLIDVLNDPRDFRVRLAGTHVRDFAGTEVTGRLIGDVFPPSFNAEVHRHWSSCVDRKAPKIAAGKHWVPARDYVEWEAIVLPLSSDGATVDMLLGGAVFVI